MAKKIILTESQLKQLIKRNAKMNLNESTLFRDDEIHDPIKDAHAEHETAWDRMYNSDEWVQAQQNAGGYSDEEDEMNDEEDEMDSENEITLNEGKISLKRTYNKFIKNPIIDSLSSTIKK